MVALLLGVYAPQFIPNQMVNSQETC